MLSTYKTGQSIEFPDNIVELYRVLFVMLIPVLFGELEQKKKKKLKP